MHGDWLRIPRGLALAVGKLCVCICSGAASLNEEKHTGHMVSREYLDIYDSSAPWHFLPVWQCVIIPSLCVHWYYLGADQWR